MAARELGRLGLRDAVALVLLFALEGSPKFEPAAVTWLARLAVEARDVRLLTSSERRLRSRACVGCAGSGRRNRNTYKCARLALGLKREPHQRGQASPLLLSALHVFCPESWGREFGGT